MRVIPFVLRSAATAGMASLAAACVIAPPGVSPRPEEDRLPAPDVAFYSFDQGALGPGSDVLTYSTTRDAYTAAFEVDHRGHVRVLTPASPRAMARSSAGTSYILYPMLHATDRDFLPASTDFSRVPFVFVLTSDTPLDLSAFGTGRSWSHELTIGARDPDSTIADVAREVLSDAPAYGADYAYVGPALRAGERQFAEQCARPVEDVHDYTYYRDLWAVFTPADQRLSVNPYWAWSPAVSWSSYALLPLASYRADFAPAAFYPGCSAQQYAYALNYGRSALGYGAFGYGLPGYYGNGLWTGSYRYGTPTVAQAPVARAIPELHVPKIPTAWGPVQAPGTTSPATPAATSALAFWHAPGRVALPPTMSGRTPGEASVAERWAIGQPRTPFVRPIERHAFEHQPTVGQGRSNAYQPGPMSHPIPGGQYGESQNRARPTSSGGSSYSGGGGQSFRSPASGSATASAPRVAAPSAPAPSSGGGGGASAGARPVAHSSGSAQQQR